MKKIRWKSMLAFVLAFMMVIGVVPVTQVNASDMGDDISVSGNGIEEQVTEDSLQEEMENQTDIEEAEDIQDNQSAGEQEEEIMPASDVDTTAPVVESYEFVENAQDVASGDMIHIRFKGYDADKSEFSADYTEVKINLPESNASSSIHAKSITPIDGTENEHVIEFQVSDGIGEEKVEITALVVGDAAGNAATIEMGNNGAGYPYFMVVKPTNTEIVIDKVVLSNTSIELTDENVEEEVQIELQFTEGKVPQDTSGSFHLRYEYEAEDGYVYKINSYIYYNETAGKWKTMESFSHGQGAGTYVLSEVTYNGERIAVNNPSSFTLSITHTDVTAPVIESVEAYWGDTKITGGETIERKGTIKFRVKVKEDSEIYDSHLSLDNDLTDFGDNSRFVSLKPDADGYYVGEVSLTATEYEADMRATEWYIGNIYFSDVYGNTTSLSDYDTIYFYIKDESGIQIPEYNYTVCILNSNGNYDRYPVTTGRVTSLDEIFPDGVPYDTEKEGYTFEGWNVSRNGVESKVLQTSDSFTVETWMSEIYIRPVYDKVLVQIVWYYYDKDGNYCNVGKEVKCDRGSTYGDLLIDLGIETELDKVVHNEDFGFIDWEIEGDLAREIQYDTWFSIRPLYNEKILLLYYYYYDKNVNYIEFYKGIPYEEGKTTYQDILDEYLVSDDAHMNGFTHWEFYFEGSDLKDVIRGEQSFLYCYSRYNSSGNTGGSGSTGGSNNSGNTGSTGGTGSTDSSTGSTVVTKPEENKEKEEESVDTTTVTIPQLRQESTVAEFPTLSGEEETAEVKPAVKLDEEVITRKVEEVQSAEEGSTFVVEMTKEDGEVATEVPVAVLEAVRGKDVNIVLDMGGYRWTINGQDVLATDLSAINLEVTMDTEAVAPSIVEKLAGGEPTRQISLTHNGDFGFKASLTINVGNEHEGEFGNLYYHDSNGKLVFMNAGQVDADGNVSLDFSHASDYVVVVGRDRTEEESRKMEETTEESMPAEIIDEEVIPVEEETGSTGNGVIPVVIVLIVVAAAVGIIAVKKNKKA